MYKFAYVKFVRGFNNFRIKEVEEVLPTIEAIVYGKFVFIGVTMQRDTINRNRNYIAIFIRHINSLCTDDRYLWSKAEHILLARIDKEVNHYATFPSVFFIVPNRVELRLAMGKVNLIVARR